LSSEKPEKFIRCNFPIRPERFVVLDHAHRSLVQVERLEDGGASVPGPYELCFTLTLLENHQGRLMERLLKAPSQ